MSRQYDNRSRDHIKETMTMERVLDMLGMEPPNRQHKIRSIYTDERTPSLHVYERSYYCFATGNGGDVIQFVQHARHVSYGEALRILGGEAPVSGRKRTPPRRRREAPDLTTAFATAPAGNEEARSKATALVSGKWPYLNLDDLIGFGVKIAERALMIPHKDKHGYVRGIKLRNLSDGAKHAVTGSQFTSGLYSVLDLAAPKAAILCEGESDTWCLTKWVSRSPYSAHIQVYGLPSGAGTWRDEWVAQLAVCDGVVAIFDEDPAGHRALERIEETLLAADLYFTYVWPPGGRVAEAMTTSGDWLYEPLEPLCK